MIDTTREQESAAEFVAGWYGRSAIEPSHLFEYTRNVVVIGLTDDIERSAWMIRPDGAVSNVAWFDPALEHYLKTISLQRRPMLVPRVSGSRGLPAFSPRPR